MKGSWERLDPNSTVNLVVSGWVWTCPAGVASFPGCRQVGGGGWLVFDYQYLLLL